MADFGIKAIMPGQSSLQVHTFGYATVRVVGDLFRIYSDDESTLRWYATALGDVIPGPSTAADLATTATDGFVYIRTCDGAPTGTPSEAGNGRVPLVYDRTNKKLFAYNGAWESVTLA